MRTSENDDQLALSLDRLRHYVKMRTENPLIGIDPECIHWIHCGTQWEAMVLFSDIKRVLEAFQ